MLGRAVLALGLALVLAKPAHACGYWSLIDSENQLEVGWLINAGTVKRGETRLANLYLDLDAPGGVRVAAEHRIVFDLRKGKILRYGVTIGTVDGDTVTIDKHVYALSWGALPPDQGVRDITCSTGSSRSGVATT